MLEKIANDARIDIVKMIFEAKSGHPGGSLSCIDILIYLYQNEINLTKDNLETNQRNKLVLSKGHASPALYAALKSINVLTEQDIMTFRKINSSLQGHPNMNDIAGVDMSTGSLGQGISAAVGIALANKIKNNDYLTYVICGDGEFEEGEVYEALMSAAHYNLNHLILFLDYNGLQIDGRVEDVIGPNPFKEKFLSFGWNAIEINGHNFSEIESAVEQAKKSQKPTAIIAHTIKGKGISYMENQAGWHGKAPNQEELKKALIELGGYDNGNSN